MTIRAERDAAAQTVRITVSDSGPGIAADIYSRVTLPQFSTKVGGSGLGLTIVKRIVESHLGKLSILPADTPADTGGSGEARGAVVEIELPDRVDAEAPGTAG